MYLTVMSVRSDDRRTGLNVFLHAHEELGVPIDADGFPDVDHVAAYAPGKCVYEDWEVRPGGNTVVSYLDVAAQEGLGDDALDSALTALSVRVRGSSPPSEVRTTEVSMRFNTVLATAEAPEARLAELERLAHRARQTFARRTQPSERQGSVPLAVWIDYEADGVRLSLPPATRERLQHTLSTALRITIPLPLLSATQGEPESLLVEAVVSLTQTSRDELTRRGGLEFVAHSTGDVIRSWRVAEIEPAQP